MLKIQWFPIMQAGHHCDSLSFYMIMLLPRMLWTRETGIYVAVLYTWTREIWYLCKTSYEIVEGHLSIISAIHLTNSTQEEAWPKFEKEWWWSMTSFGALLPYYTDYCMLELS